MVGVECSGSYISTPRTIPRAAIIDRNVLLKLGVITLSEARNVGPEMLTRGVYSHSPRKVDGFVGNSHVYR